MKILLIGGTKFVGRNIVEMALQGGHQIHLLQRGKTNKDIFENVTRYIGDRDQIEKIIPESECFDIVVDCCGYHPSVVKKSAQFLQKKTDKYIFISTASVYSDFSLVGLRENSEIQTSDVTPDVNLPITGESYGLLKAQCENVVTEFFDENRSLILRPCIIVGKYDDTNRFNLLLDKIKNSSSIEVPDDKGAFIQFIDVRSLADFVLNKYSLSGVFNLIGPSQSIRFLDFINQAKAILNPKIEIKYTASTEDSFPMYVSDANWKGFFQFDGRKAYSHGLHQYSAEDTIKYVAQELGYLF